MNSGGGEKYHSNRSVDRWLLLIVLLSITGMIKAWWLAGGMPG